MQFNSQPKLLDGNVLVVDNAAATLEVVSQVLEEAGCEVSVALDGALTLELVSIHSPDLILLDIQMPGIDGFEICQQLKEGATTREIPIIFMSVLNDADSKLKAFDMGAVDYITKPFQEKELLVRVRTHLTLRRLTQSLQSSVASSTSELPLTLDQLHKSQLQVMQREKMSALGSLMSGIAHELNNPLGFLDGSVTNAQCYVQDLVEHIALYQECYPIAHEDIADNAEDINLDFLIEDLQKLLFSMKMATHRMKSVSTSLRNYSRADTDHLVSTDLQEGLDGTLLLLTYRLKGDDYRPAIQVVREYSDCPPVECFSGQLNQVFMNILANMIDMFDEMAQERSQKTPKESSAEYFKQHPQVITISTKILENDAEIRIRDNGKGMSAEVKARIFERLFTTKAVGKGTGLGLAISHQIVVDNHGGSLEVLSAPGEGSEFCIKIPMLVP